MKYLYLQILRLRVWMLRRRLRKMGFRDVADNTSPEMIARLLADLPRRPRTRMPWMKALPVLIGLMVCIAIDLKPKGAPETVPSAVILKARPDHSALGQTTHEEGTP